MNHARPGWSRRPLWREVAEAIATLVAAAITAVGLWLFCVMVLLAGQS